VVKRFHAHWNNIDSSIYLYDYVVIFPFFTEYFFIFSVDDFTFNINGSWSIILIIIINTIFQITSFSAKINAFYFYMLLSYALSSIYDGHVQAGYVVEHFINIFSFYRLYFKLMMSSHMKFTQTIQRAWLPLLCYHQLILVLLLLLGLEKIGNQWMGTHISLIM
jgi:hypothetical protein